MNLLKLTIIMPHQLSQYNDYTTAWTIQGSNPGRGRRYNSSDL